MWNFIMLYIFRFMSLVYYAWTMSVQKIPHLNVHLLEKGKHLKRIKRRLKEQQGSLPCWRRNDWRAKNVFVRIMKTLENWLIDPYVVVLLKHRHPNSASAEICIHSLVWRSSSKCRRLFLTCNRFTWWSKNHWGVNISIYCKVFSKFLSYGHTGGVMGVQEHFWMHILPLDELGGASSSSSFLFCCLLAPVHHLQFDDAWCELSKWYKFANLVPGFFCHGSIPIYKRLGCHLIPARHKLQ